MNPQSLESICSPEHPPEVPKPGLGSNSPSLARWVDPDADELHTHSQTQPYLRNEPVAIVTPGATDGFFRHIFKQGITVKEANIDLSDLKYNPAQPRQAEVLLERKLNGCINSSSYSKFQSFRPFLHVDAR
jgi:hypothetical protein